MSKLQSSINSVSSSPCSHLYNLNLCEGEQPWNLGQHLSLCQSHHLLLLHAKLPDKEAEGEVDPGAEHPVLLFLHSGPVLP